MEMKNEVYIDIGKKKKHCLSKYKYIIFNYYLNIVQKQNRKKKSNKI